MFFPWNKNYIFEGNSIGNDIGMYETLLQLYKCMRVYLFVMIKTNAFSNFDLICMSRSSFPNKLLWFGVFKQF